jgi:hypothetical protein
MNDTRIARDSGCASTPHGAEHYSSSWSVIVEYGAFDRLHSRVLVPSPFARLLYDASVWATEIKRDLGGSKTVVQGTASQLKLR